MLILDLKNTLLNFLGDLSGGDPIIRGLITVWLLSVVSYFSRSIPGKIISFIKNNTTVSIRITKEEDIKASEFFMSVQEWFIKNNWFSIRNRSSNVNELDSFIGFGIGNHIAFCNGRLFFIDKSLLSVSSIKNIEVLFIKTIGRNADVFNPIIEQCRVTDGKRYFLEVIDVWMPNPWRKTGVLKSSPKIFLNDTVSKELHTCLDNFINNREWYKKNNKPYRLNIILYGPPGTGKTELIRYISEYLSSDLYNVPPNKMDQRILTTLSGHLKGDKMGVIAIEDFESIALRRDLQIKAKEYESIRNSNNIEEIKKISASDKEYDLLKNIPSLGIDISDLLNALQGLKIIENIVIVMTTNHIDFIDEAVTRGSRCDLKLYVGPLGLKQVKAKFEYQYNKSFPSYIRDLKDIKACDLDALSSQNIDDSDCFITSLIANYGVVENENQLIEAKQKALENSEINQ